MLHDDDRALHVDTKLIHAGEWRPRIEGAVVMPIFQSASFQTREAADYHDIHYLRLSNTPNHVVLHRKLAALEGAEAAVVAASGMAAITTALLSVLRRGDHLLVQRCLYGGTHAFVTRDLPELGIEHDWIDAGDPASWERQLRPNTRAIYVETLTNPLLELGDLPAVARFARAHGLVSLVDNTFATPLGFCPAAHGFDLSLHSATKYLNGHSDLVAGAVIGRAELLERIKHRLDHLGGCLDAHACALLHRGLKTLALRVRRQWENAQRLAEFLESHPAVARVHYPGLESHPQHRLARELLQGFGGMLSFVLRDGLEGARRLVGRLRLAVFAPSLGGVETLVTLPAMTSHASLSPQERARAGIDDALVRVSVGIEAPEDLLEDFRQALA